MRLIYAGTPDFAVAALARIIAAGHEVAAVYTQPDRPAGRGRKLQASPVKETALENGIPVEQPINFKSAEAREHLASYGAEAMVVAAYGLILPQSVLDVFPKGCINIHASLLPRWRGAAPIQRAMLAGDTESGVCIMQMEAGLDTGPVLSTHKLRITAHMTGGMLHDALATLGAEAIVSSLRAIEDGVAVATAQDDSMATYAEKLNKAEAEIDWTQAATRIDAKIRGFNPWPVAQTRWKGKSIRLWNSTLSDHRGTQPAGDIIAADNQGIHVQTGQGVVAVTELQLPGKKRVKATDFINAQNPVGTRFGE